MTNIIEFPTERKRFWVSLERKIDDALSNVKPEYRGKIKKEALDTLKQYETYFSNYSLELPATVTQQQIQGIQEMLNQETKRKQDLVIEIISLRIKSLIDNLAKNR